MKRFIIVFAITCVLAALLFFCRGRRTVTGVSFPEPPIEIACNEDFGMGLINYFNIIRLKDGTYRCEYINLYPWQKGVDVWRRTQDCIRDLERVIRRHPSCWVLNYRYFRKKPKEADLQQLAQRKAKQNEQTGATR